MSTRFCNLPEDCVQLIFDRIPVHHLLLVRGVSRAWQRHQQLNCRGRKSLIILHGNEPFHSFANQTNNKPLVDHNIDHKGNSGNYKFFLNHNKIQISTNKNPKVKYLVSTFPHLHTLIVCTDPSISQTVKSVTYLIARYSTKLVTLNLNFCSEIKKSSRITSISDIVGNLINRLNSCTSLRYLIFRVEDSIIEPSIEEPKFLTRVKEFYFDFYRLEKVMLDWVRKYDQAGQLDQMERFFLNTWKDNPVSIEHIHLASVYTFVPAIDYFDNEEFLKKVVTKFPSLITLKQKLSNWGINSLTKLATILSPLTKLVHVKLTIQVLPRSEISQNCTPQLKSIKALDLFFSDFYSKLLPTFCQTHVTTIVQCFPSLQSIRIVASHVNGQINLEDYAEQFFIDLKFAYKKASLRTKFLRY